MAKTTRGGARPLEQADRRVTEAGEMYVSAVEHADRLRREAGEAEAAAWSQPKLDGFATQELQAVKAARRARVVEANERFNRAVEGVRHAAQRLEGARHAREQVRLEVLRPEIEAGHQRVRQAAQRFLDAWAAAWQAAGEAADAWRALEVRDLPQPGLNDVAAAFRVAFPDPVAVGGHTMGLLDDAAQVGGLTLAGVELTPETTMQAAQALTGGGGGGGQRRGR